MPRLDVGPAVPAVASARSAHRSRSSPRVGETRQLLLHERRTSPDAALKRALLEQGPRLAIPIPGGEVAADALEAREPATLGRQEVAVPAGAEGGIGGKFTGRQPLPTGRSAAAVRPRLDGRAAPSAGGVVGRAAYPIA